MEVLDFTRDMVTDVIDFERRLRVEEPFYRWDIDEVIKNALMAANEEAQILI